MEGRSKRSSARRQQRGEEKGAQECRVHVAFVTRFRGVSVAQRGKDSATSRGKDFFIDPLCPFPSSSLSPGLSSVRSFPSSLSLCLSFSFSLVRCFACFLP